MTPIESLHSASAEYEGGRIIRASTAMRILGVSRATYCSWAKFRKVRRVRIWCSRSRKTPSGEIVALYLDDVIACWQAHISRRRWREDEIETLHNLYGMQNNALIAKKLGRSERSVESKANHMGLKVRDSQGYICAADLAHILGVSPQRVRYWFSRTNNPLKRIKSRGRRWLMCDVRDVVSWLDDTPKILANLEQRRVDHLRRIAVPAATRRRNAGGAA